MRGSDRRACGGGGSALSRRTLVLRYIAFAVIATLANLLSQRVVLAGALPGASYQLALFAGTLVGLFVKYVLDKRWIFHDLSQGIAAHGKRFPLYVLMGVATTAIFWGTETAFWITWHTQGARELGAVLGLSIGYFVKYRLDRRFVFSPPAPGKGLPA